jgi:hypothetical protein
LLNVGERVLRREHEESGMRISRPHFVSQLLVARHESRATVQDVRRQVIAVTLPVLRGVRRARGVRPESSKEARRELEALRIPVRRGLQDRKHARPRRNGRTTPRAGRRLGNLAWVCVGHGEHDIALNPEPHELD